VGHLFGNLLDTRLSDTGELLFNQRMLAGQQL
jgi:hypothetical protein